MENDKEFAPRGVTATKGEEERDLFLIGSPGTDFSVVVGVTDLFLVKAAFTEGEEVLFCNFVFVLLYDCHEDSSLSGKSSSKSVP
jgi:hypothetical protein